MSFRADDPFASRALLRVGTVLCGRYRLVRLIGVGGMGAVYAGTHRNGHAVAIKILHERLSTDPEIERLFRREAQLANKVNHPAVVPVIDDDVGDDGCVFLVMPLLEGETLRAYGERHDNKLSPGDVVAIAHAVLDVLAAAHAQKIVHRDIKPENIFLTREGELRVLDFGIARFFETNEAAPATRSGRAVGTPAFMAPEQALGRLREVDGRTDLWAVGATMFTLLAGRYVHEAETGSEVIVHAATRPARPLAHVAPNVSAAICEVVDRALAFDREARWGDAASMDRALLSAYASSSGQPLPALPRAAVPDPQENRDAVHSVLTQVPPGPVGASPASRRPNDVVEPTERLRGATTRTTTGALSIQGRHDHRLRWGRGGAIARLAIGGGALLAIAAAFAGWKMYRSNAETPVIGVPVPSVPSTQIADIRAIHDATIARCSSDARPLLAAGLQLWRDASQWEALPKFEAAASADPQCAAASLYYLFAATHNYPRRSEHFRRVRDLRGSLAPREVELLDAITPSYMDPPDNPASDRALASLVQRFPDDHDVVRLRARLLRRSHDHAEVLRVLDADTLHRLGRFPAGWFFRALSLVDLHRPDEATDAFRECLHQSPDSGDCLLWLSLLDGSMGRCAEAETTARRMLSAIPDSNHAHDVLGLVLLATTNSAETATAAFEPRWHFAGDSYFGFEGDASTVPIVDRYRIAALSGDIPSAQIHLREWLAATATSRHAGIHGVAVTEAIAFLSETGSVSEARVLARRSLEQRRAWTEDWLHRGDIDLEREAFLVGAIDAATFRNFRDEWVARHAPDGGSDTDPVDTAIWLSAFAGIPELYKEAIPPPALGDYVQGWYEMSHDAFSRAALDALWRNRLPDAERHAKAAANACLPMFPAQYLRARDVFGRVEEASGHIESACHEYRWMTRMMATASDSPLEKGARAALERLHCKEK